MFKSISCAAMALVSCVGFAQTPNAMPASRPDSGIYSSDADLLSSPPMIQKNGIDLQAERRNVEFQFRELSGPERFDGLDMMDHAPGNVTLSLIQALFNIRCEANVARHNMLVQYVSTMDAAVATPSKSYVYFTSPSPVASSPVMPVSSFSDHENRTFNMLLKHDGVCELDYDKLLDVIDSELSSGAATEVNSWFWQTATQNEKDVLRQLIKQDVAMEKAPIYASTLTPINL